MFKKPMIIVLLLCTSISFGQKNTFTPLRSNYQTLSDDEVKSMLSQRGFYDSSWHKSKTFNNLFDRKTINGDEVVLDHATSLMWQQGGSSNSLKFDEAKDWIANLNKQGYAGYHDWRLPTLEEGASLLESSKRNGELYIDPIFSRTQSYIWTGDMFGSSSAWVVSFFDGYVFSYYYALRNDFYVRVVRSEQ